MTKGNRRNKVNYLEKFQIKREHVLSEKICLHFSSDKVIILNGAKDLNSLN